MGNSSEICGLNVVTNLLVCWHRDTSPEMVALEHHSGPGLFDTRSSGTRGESVSSISTPCLEGDKGWDFADSRKGLGRWGDRSVSKMLGGPELEPQKSGVVVCLGIPALGRQRQRISGLAGYVEF